MPDISIKIRNKIAQVQGSPLLVCGNSDYAVTFDFDEEWDDYDSKTMHVVWMDHTGKLLHYDVLFEGGTALLPAIYNTDRVCIGVYAGDIRTTTPACVPCARCITDGDPYHGDPPPDVYQQLMEYMEEIIAGGGGGGGGGGGIPVSTSGAVVPTLYGVTSGIIGTPQAVLPNRAYIQASGSQGINTGFTPSTTSVEYRVEFADFETPASGWAEIHGGYWYGVKAQPGAWSINPDKNSGNMVLCIGNNDLFGPVDVPRSGYHELTTTISNGNVSVNIDGDITVSDTWDGRLDCPVGLCCGVALENGSSRLFEFGTLKVYRFRIYESGSLVRDFVPALGTNDRPAFYDNVTQTYFYSETGTDFVYVPAETEG